jgi:hypothetical protein
MDRLNQEDTNSQTTAEASESAVEKLRSRMEAQVRRVVEEAMARALSIEDRATEKANQMEQESRRQGEEVLRESHEAAARALSSAIERAEEILGAAARLQSELDRVIDSLRDDIKRLTSELRAENEALAAPPPTASSASPQATEVAGPAGQRDRNPGEMIRQQLTRLRDGGTPRAEAERYLGRFKQGEGYAELLDEVYGPAEQVARRGRGLLHR